MIAAYDEDGRLYMVRALTELEDAFRAEFEDHDEAFQLAAAAPIFVGLCPFDLELNGRRSLIARDSLWALQRVQYQRGMDI